MKGRGGMVGWKNLVAGFLTIIRPPVFGAGFKREGVDLAGRPGLISFDGHSFYFFGMSEREAAGLLDGIALLNGYTGWLAYMLQDVFYDEEAGEDLYGEIYDSLAAGVLKGPRELSVESVYRWVESAAPEVEKIKRKLLKNNNIGTGYLSY